MMKVLTTVFSSLAISMAFSVNAATTSDEDFHALQQECISIMPASVQQDEFLFNCMVDLMDLTTQNHVAPENPQNELLSQEIESLISMSQ